MRRSALTFFLAALVLLSAHAKASAKDTWTSVRSQNFFLVGNAGEKEIRQVATRLEQFRHVFSRLFKRARLSDTVPTTVVVFKNAGSYKPFNPRDAGGYFQPGEDVNYITINAERRPGVADNPYAIIFHEYMHLLVKNNISPNTPAWVNEGLAEFYSTLEVAKGEKEADVGRLIDDHVLYLRQQKQLPLRTLFAVDHSSPHYNEKSKRGVFYAQSWALVHYLMLGKERQRQPQLGRYLSLIGGGATPEESFRAAFGADAEAIERELRDYIRNDKYPYATFPFEERLEFDAAMQSREITEAEALSYLGDLALHTRLLELAETNLQKAVALDPDSAMAHASLGMLRMRQKRFAEAKEHLRRAVGSDARNHLAHYYYAYTLSREGMNDMGLVSSYAPETAGEMRAALKKAIALKPEFAESYHLLAFVNLVTNEQLDESVEMLKRALALAPGKQEFHLILAQLHLRRRDLDAARKLVEPLAESAPDPQTRASAQSLLSSITRMQEQLSDLKAARDERDSEEDSSGGDVADDATSDDRGQPRLRRREDLAGDEEAVGKSQEEAMADALRGVLRKPLAGETRARGMLVRVECTNRGTVFHVKAGEQALRLQGGDMSGVIFMAFTPEAGGQLGCGPRKPESHVVVTYRAKAKGEGELVSVEFVPPYFQLK